MVNALGARQRWAFLLAGASAVAATSLCGFSWLPVLLGTAAAMAVCLVLDGKLRPCGAALTLCHGGIFGRLLAAATLAFTVVALAWAANLAGEAFPTAGGSPVLGWTLLALAAWGSYKGSAACAAAAGVLCLMLLALYGLVAGFSLPEVSLPNLTPGGSWHDGAVAAGLMLLPGAVFFLPSRRRRKGVFWRGAALAALGAAGLCAVTAGVLTPELAAAAPAPLYLLSQSLSLFGVMEHIEPLLSVAMTMGLFALMAILACAARALGARRRFGRWWGAAACLAAAAVEAPATLLPDWVIPAGAAVFFGLLPLSLLLTGQGRRAAPA